MEKLIKNLKAVKTKRDTHYNKLIKTRMMSCDLAWRGRGEIKGSPTLIDLQE